MYESKVAELHSDLNSLKREVESKQQEAKLSEKERMALVSELTEQNQRLTAQLRSAVNAEEQLATQLQSLRDQFNARRSNMTDHVGQLELLREEIVIISEKKADLERRLHNLTEERDSISLTLDESSDRILLMEKLNMEQEIKIRNQDRDLEELRQINALLQERVEFLCRRSSTPASLAQTSLLNEIEMSEDDGHQTGSNLHSYHLPSTDDIDEEDDDIECDDSVLSPLLGQQQETGGEMMKLKEEVLDVYVQLRNLCMQVKHRRGSLSSASTSSEETGIADVKVGLLTDCVKQLKGLLHDILRREAKGACQTCGRGPNDREDLERDLNITREELIRTQRKLAEKIEDGKHKNEQILNLTGKINIQQIELQNLTEERDLLRKDLQSSALSRDEVISKAWEVRDKALARKNNLEIDLARTRIEVMNVNSQLIEAITQKLELSQQLEMWQVDMQALLDEQMCKKLSQHEQEDRHQIEDSDGYTSGSGPSSTKPKLFGLWR